MNNLKHYRELRGYSQEQLAELVGTKQPTIQRTETGATASLPLLARCAEILKINMMQMFATHPTAELDQVLVALDNLKPESHPVFLAALTLAEALPPEEGDSDTEAAEETTLKLENTDRPIP